MLFPAAAIPAKPAKTLSLCLAENNYLRCGVIGGEPISASEAFWEQQRHRRRSPGMA
jgi:hypothetical protein